MILYSIILPYYNRKSLIINTLNSYEKYYKNYNNLEIVIVDDGSSKEHKLTDIINNYKLNIKLIELRNKINKTEVNPCVPYNIGVRNSCGKIIILSSPEIFHTNDIFKLSNNIEKLNNNSCIFFSVFCSTDKELTDNIINNNYIVNEENKKKMNLNMSLYKFNNEYGSWYLHSIYRKTHLNFLSCMTRETYYELSGFDERYRFGTGYDDVEFLDRLKMKIKDFIYYDTAYAIHIDHEIVHNLPINTNSFLYNSKLKYDKNDNWGLIK